jgi:hypothetical protein
MQYNVFFDTFTTSRLPQQTFMDSNERKVLPLWSYKEQPREPETYQDLKQLPFLQRKGQTLSTLHEFKLC